MSLKETIETEYKNALKSKDKSKISTYRLIYHLLKILILQIGQDPIRKKQMTRILKSYLGRWLSKEPNQ